MRPPSIALTVAEGIDVLDTAANYGEAENVMAALDTRPFCIAIKTIGVKGGMDAVVAQARASKAALPQADTLLVHGISDLDNPALWPVLRQLQKDGVFSRSAFPLILLMPLAALAARLRLDAIHLPFSSLDQWLVHNGTLARLAELSVEIHAHWLFLRWLLLMTPETLPKNLASAAPRLTALRARLDGSGTAPLGAALRFALSRPEVAISLAGVTGLAELNAIMAANNHLVPSMDWQPVLCTMSNY